jgi:hypothetical protein
MVVARGAFGVNVELFGSRADALAYYNKCRSSRMMSSMRDNNVINNFFENPRVEMRLRQKAQGARNFLLGGHQMAGQLVHDTNDSGRVSFAGEFRVTPGASAVVFVAHWGHSAWHYTVQEIKGAVERQQAVDGFMESCKKQKEISKAAVLTLRGLTVLSAYSDSLVTRTASVVAQSQLFVRTLPCLLVLHIGGHCTARVLSTIAEGLESLDRLPTECSAILVSTKLEILAKHRCDIPSFREELCLYAGGALLSTLHHCSHIAVVSPRDVVCVTTNLYTAQSAASAEQLTHFANRGDVPIVVLGLSNESKYWDLTRDESSYSLDEAASELFELWILGTPQMTTRPVKAQLPAHRLTQAARSLISACRGRAAAQQEAGKPGNGDEAAQRGVNIFSSASCSLPASAKMAGGVGARSVSPQVAQDMLMCNICMEVYDTTQRKPVMCPSCGNTICFECWRQTRECPMSRCEKPARPVMNIALLQLLSPVDQQQQQQTQPCRAE